MLATGTVRWIKHSNTDTRKISTKDLRKTNDTDREEQDQDKKKLKKSSSIACVGNYSQYLSLSHRYNFEPHTRESGNTWKV